MADSPFSNPEIHARIAADVARIQSTWLEWNAEPTTGDFDTRIVETLVDTLDAHARRHLEAVDENSRLPEYHKLLRCIGSSLIENAERRSFLSDPNSEDRLRKMAENTGDFIRRKHSLTPEQQEEEVRNAVERLRSEVMPDAKKWNERYCQILIRIEARFEARYRHWAAEAIERVEPARVANGTDGGGASWRAIEISFLSDERVQIRNGTDIETRNYGELGFADRRAKRGKSKPNQAWVTLRMMAEQNGIIRDGAKTGATWPKVEKRIQEIRKVLRKHFSVTADPIPFVEGTGYQACFKIGCSPSYQT